MSAMPMTTEPDRLVARLASLDVCCVSDAMDALGLTGAVQGIAPLWAGARLAGRAVTTKLAAGPAPAGAPAVHLGVSAIERCGTGDVIVVDNEGRTEMGGWGGLLSVAASVKGVAGVIVDGACRDVDEARDLGFPTFGRSPVARTARGRVHEVSCGEPVGLGGVTVSTGDLVLADTSGVVVLAKAVAEQVIERAEQIAERERVMQERLRAGDRISEVLGASYEHMLHRPPAGS